MERMYAVMCFNGLDYSHVECVCDSLTDAYARCDRLNKEHKEDYETYFVSPTFYVKEGEE